MGDALRSIGALILFLGPLKTDPTMDIVEVRPKVSQVAFFVQEYAQKLTVATSAAFVSLRSCVGGRMSCQPTSSCTSM